MLYAWCALIGLMWRVDFKLIQRGIFNYSTYFEAFSRYLRNKQMGLDQILMVSQKLGSRGGGCCGCIVKKLEATKFFGSQRFTLQIRFKARNEKSNQKRFS